MESNSKPLPCHRNSSETETDGQASGRASIPTYAEILRRFCPPSSRQGTNNNAWRNHMHFTILTPPSSSEYVPIAQLLRTVEIPSVPPSRKRVLSSHETPSPKRANKVANGDKGTCTQSVNTQSRGLATAAACPVTSQQPRDSDVDCSRHQENHGNANINLKTRWIKTAAACPVTSQQPRDPSVDCSRQGENHGQASLETLVKKRKIFRCKKHGRIITRKRVEVRNNGNNQPQVLNTTKDEEDDFNIFYKKKNGTIYATTKDENRILGTGGFGTVYKGFKIEGQTKTPVAIKLIPTEKIKHFVEDSEFGIVPREVSMLNEVKDHPNAIQLIDCFPMSKFIAIVMERPLNCEDLFAFLEKRLTLLPENDARKIIKQLCSILLAMEKKNIVHKDIKAENVLINLDNGQVKLIDFGLATTFKPGEPFKTFDGTVNYTPPEFIHTGQYEGPKDTVWTLGLLLYGTVCDHSPFDGMIDTSVRLSFPSHLSSELKNLLIGMLKTNPDQRLTLEQVYNHSWMATETEIRKT